jgi:hypothetical protein
MPAAPAFQRALGLAVKTRRRELGLTQEELSLRAQLHQRSIAASSVSTDTIPSGDLVAPHREGACRPRHPVSSERPQPPHPGLGHHSLRHRPHRR